MFRSRSSRSAFFMLPLFFMLPACAGDPGTDSWKSVTPGTAPAGSPVALHGQLRVESLAGEDAAGNPMPVAQLVNSAGVPVQLKGVSSMWLNWVSQAYAESKPALKFMRDNWKVSVIRASMGTEAAEGYLSNPAKSKYQVETMIHNAIDLGVYILVDWHTEKAVAQTAESVAFFTELATKYGAYPNVIWETYNEPTQYQWPAIKTYHQTVVDAIRTVDPDNLIVLGTPNWSQRVDVVAAEPVVGTNLLYTLHFYSCSHGQFLRDFGNKALAAGLALFVTEFGATFADGGVAPNHDYVCEDESNLWFAWMAKYNISGAAWKLDACSDTSCILNSKAGVDGPWTDDKLSSNVGGALYTGALQGGATGAATKGGHGLFIVNWLRQ